jgi:hypothetical protein
MGQECPLHTLSEVICLVSLCKATVLITEGMDYGARFHSASTYNPEFTTFISVLLAIKDAIFY